ncbi:MAG: tRNA preQ1(34) S-adenosylmethionine ribosyltransferase-isomerase QueA [Firmicutes bacterium]|nr:tRNA preQ1(34) S-adenosylmethionine ribosyltransferase-isomerase QueA [Bacillota bacterium]
MKVDEFDFTLPEELIAQTPLEFRDQSRLIVVSKNTFSFQDQVFTRIIDYLRPEDVLVLNDTRVLPARLYGRNRGQAGPVEILLLRPLGNGRWEVLVKPGKRARVGAEIVFSPDLQCRVLEITPSGGRLVDFKCRGDFYRVLNTLGKTPLPPYIHRRLDNPERYQTVYSKNSGSAAAPTAGLHFTTGLLEQIQKQGTAIAALTLHVGLGTFRPVRAENVEEHIMHEEFYYLPETSAEIINARKKAGGRIFAVGTTSVRVLETVVDAQGMVQPGSGWTKLFIYPGYQFKAVDALLTNFHLPRSSLLMLVSAFAGTATIKAVYKYAVEQRYRFFSFGDAMLLL